MSKITALFAVLVLGSSASAAMASSSRPYDSRPGIERMRFERTRVERDRIDRIDRTDRTDRLDRTDRTDRSWSRGGARDDFGPRRYRPTWTALSASLQLGRTGRDSIAVTDGGTFTQLRLQTAGGVARIDRVIVQFADGSDQVADTDRVLDDRDELLEIPLDGNNRRIDRITVFGAGARGTLQVFGI